MTADRDSQTVFRLFNEIAIIAQLSGHALEKVMPDRMTMSQFGVLNHLARLGGNQMPLKIAEAMQVTKGTMTNTLGHLERKRWIVIVPDGRDGRSKRVDITAEGLAVRNDAIARLTPEFADMMQGFSPGDLSVCLETLEQIRRILDRRRTKDA